MRILFAFVLCLALAISPWSSAKSPKPTKNAQYVDYAVSALIKQFGDGLSVSYPQQRQILWGKVFDFDSEPRADDAIAFFAIEGFGGGNDHAEYLAFFVAVSPTPAGKTLPYRLEAVTQIGGRGWRTFDWDTAVIRPNEITVSGKQLGEKDGFCCPSVPIAVTFRVVKGSIVEVQK